MINKKRIRSKLLQMFLLASIVTFLTAAALDAILQSRFSSLSARSEMINRWLRGEITQAHDKALNDILVKLTTELSRARNNFAAPEGGVTPEPVPMLRPTVSTDGADNQLKQVLTLPAKPGESNVYVAFGASVYHQFNPLEFPHENGKPPDALDYQRDEKSYRLFTYPFYASVKSANLDQSGDVASAMKTYSDRVFKQFGVTPDSMGGLPELTISNIYASSSNGTMVIFPWNSLNLPAMKDEYKIKERSWYLSAYGNEKGKNTQGTELLPNPTNDPSSAFGLAPFYVDVVSKDYVRTLWYRFKVHDDRGQEITYVLCIDLSMSSALPPLLIQNVLPSWMAGRDGLSEALFLGLFSGLLVLTLGSALVLLLSSTWPQSLGFFLVRRRPKEWVTEESFTPIYQAFAPQRRIIFQDVKKHEGGVERKVSFSAWFQMNVAKLALERTNFTRDASQLATTEEVTLNSIDQDPSLRGYEVWRVFRSRRRSEGLCRLCGQEVEYREEDEQIAEPTIRHRRTQVPAIDTRLATNSRIRDTKSLEEAITWQATDVETKAIGAGYRLTSAPAPRIPDFIQELHAFKDSLKTFQMLSQSRIEVDDCVELSVEVFRKRNVRAVCHIDYFQKIASGGEASLAALQQGENIERILVANKPEDMVNFLKTYRRTIESLLKARNHELFRMYLEDTGVDFNTFGNQRFDLDFAVIYGEGEPPLVLVSNLSELSRTNSVKGYLSWRPVDVLFFKTLYDSFTGARLPLRLSDLPAVDADTSAPQ